MSGWSRLHSGRVVSLNALSNAVVLVSNALATALVLSYILRVMSKAEYGVWELTGAIFAYAGFLQLGLNSAVSFWVPKHLVEGDSVAIHRVVSTTVGFYLAGSSVVVLLTGGLALGLPHLFQIPPEYVAPGQKVVALTGAYFALMLPLVAFQGVLTGTQNHLRMNAVRFASLVGRVGLTVWLLHRGHGLVGLALAQLIPRVLEMLCMPWLVRGVLPQLRVAPRYFDRGVLRSMLGFGVNSFLWRASATFLARGSLVMVGILLTTQDVTELGVLLTVIGTVAAISDSLAMVVRPAATSLMAREDATRVRQLNARATSLVLGALLPLAVVLLAFGPGLLTVWLGSDYTGLAPMLAVLVIAQLIFETQRVGVYVTIGLGKHRRLGWFSLAIVGVGIGVGAILAAPLGRGLWGVTLGHVTALLLMGAVILPRYVGRILNTGAWAGQGQPLVRPFLAVGPATALALLTGSRFQPQSLAELVAVGGTVALVVIGSLWAWGWNQTQRDLVLDVIARRTSATPAATRSS